MEEYISKKKLIQLLTPKSYEEFSLDNIISIIEELPTMTIGIDLAKTNANTCVACGKIIPEGSQVCTNCILKENYD